VSVSQTLWRWAEGAPIFDRAAITLGISPHPSYIKTACSFWYIILGALIVYQGCAPAPARAMPSSSVSGWPCTLAMSPPIVTSAQRYNVSALDNLIVYRPVPEFKNDQVTQTTASLWLTYHHWLTDWLYLFASKDGAAPRAESLPSYCTQWWTLSVTKWWRLSVELSWQHLRRSMNSGKIFLSPKFGTNFQRQMP